MSDIMGYMALIDDLCTKVGHEQFEFTRHTGDIGDSERIAVENVPARVNPGTGEQLLSPQTVERLRGIVGNRRQPTGIIQTPVYEFAS